MDGHEDEGLITFIIDLIAGLLILTVEISIWFLVTAIVLLVSVVVWFFDEEAAMEMWEHIGDD